ncbi:MAG: tRNA guanosine(34) transglycosylase Tgt [Candidatus Doudnabacteria bacterium RIFCSPHIGHO2_02_FULL_48_21]|uniref:Queuine tRNA-ribosyltransferase n=1 Tax=Candidatus Doudnabacteria bacterium RIFCSPLOWO2_02_FULL_48_13 TaxID=1817845 RepID=A0A1F5QAC7_9BACT|nr:MAG: tRNA guanosine(34) transglycosylase Tgt [Candidatus Doudnabacteria bacterium RIFCSPHIGHO2_01_48_18]OGE78769.1 MAG: tRNA guanosine(34) transglycosylase Tgt [Candidatus Doudnabacteria bacterium RIFCSPHIGHO2_01_FULL_48_180]OGE91312.1 MAG: tRNA guanosine(34) transglycosylase Tgt [Candidatus Doudnabacteria bacterium RIFCSPHIGHO2_12_FULL_47_25]OGE93310.1 MAG: tRNA guanosine(34) transglycosylase Tgt [Candidatus Doudnabacteria bacterium RIFCSPHIGHO2_02_FULL_48_21]OGE96642.1 MAG: tRNA guanosine(
MDFFQILKNDINSKARLGIINTAHGPVKTPAFLPIGTRGSVKAVTSEELRFWGAEMILANTYHLWMRPGDALINKAGGLHKFMGWDGPIFTDSGGYQVYSLGEKITESTSERKPTLKKITEKGVEFRNELDGALHVLSPEESIQIQSNLGSDIAVVLDDVPGLPATKTRLESSLELTLKWAERAKKQFEKITPESVNPGQKLFGVVQGGDREYLRKKSVRALQKIGFDGYGIGGLAIGAVADDPEIMYRVIDFTVPYLEDDKPRHLLGVGYPEQIIKSIALGMDTFDCVIPTRNARHGELFINQKNGNGAGYAALKILNKQYAEDFTPIDNTCSCYGCRHHNRAYLRHLFMSGEPLGIRLATMHNLRFYLDFMEKVRRSIEFESFSELLALYQ